MIKFQLQPTLFVFILFYKNFFENVDTSIFSELIDNNNYRYLILQTAVE